jgi:hypothetical protein
MWSKGGALGLQLGGTILLPNSIYKDKKNHASFEEFREHA